MGQDLVEAFTCNILHLCKILVQYAYMSQLTHQICGLSSTRAIKSTDTQVRIVGKQVSFAGRFEMDTHADTCALGWNFVQLHTTMQTALVSPYNNQYKPVHNVPIVTGATAIQLELTGETIILIIHQVLWFSKLFGKESLNHRT